MTPWTGQHLVGLDTETTGLQPSVDRVFEIGIVTYEGHVKVDEWSVLLNPGRPLSQESVEKTGIRDEDLVNCPSFRDVAAEIIKRLQSRIVVGYNILFFDWPMLQAEFSRLGIEPPQCYLVDVLVFARGLVPQGRHSLQEMVSRYGLTMETAHRATADADAAVRLLLAMSKELPQDLQSLLELQSQWAGEQRARRATWRQKSSERSALLQQETRTTLIDESGRVRLGPGYLFGRETDPLRAFISQFIASGQQD